MRVAALRQELVGMIDRALGADPKAALIAARCLAEEIDWLQQRAVLHARVNGYNWGQIGRLMGLTRQGARQKFPLARPKPPPHVVANDRYFKEQRRAEQLLQRLRNGNVGQPPEEDPVFW